MRALAHAARPRPWRRRVDESDSPRAFATVKVDFDGDLLEKLRARRPGKDDRTLLEELARIQLGFDSIARVRRRNALSEEEANDLAVRAVREVRAEMR